MTKQIFVYVNHFLTSETDEALILNKDLCVLMNNLMNKPNKDIIDKKIGDASRRYTSNSFQYYQFLKMKNLEQSWGCILMFANVDLSIVINHYF